MEKAEGEVASQCIRLRCQRIGCEATFTEDDNPDDACTYHDSGPFFHDGMKEWSCCKQRSHDFSLFLAIPGCKTGKHTTEKPIIKTTPKPQMPTPAGALNRKNDPTTCSRCKQGFFCSDHGSQAALPRMADSIATAKDSLAAVQSPTAAPSEKKIDLNEPQTCKNKGCGKTFKEKDNHETACEYHPGPAVFHDRVKGWKCCDIHVNEFDEFMSIPPCSKGWHNGNP